MIDTGRNSSIPDEYKINVFYVNALGKNPRTKQFRLRDFLTGRDGFRFQANSGSYAIVRLELQNFAEKELFNILNQYVDDLGEEFGMKIISKLGEYARYLYDNNIELQDCEAGIIYYPYNTIMKARESNPDFKECPIIDARTDRKMRKNMYNGQWYDAKPINKDNSAAYDELKDYIQDLVMQNIVPTSHRVGLDEDILEEINKMPGYVPERVVYKLIQNKFQKTHPFYYYKDGKVQKYL